MRPDVLDLQAFYGSRQGQLVRRLVGRQIRTIWPDLSGLRLLGMGYTIPFLVRSPRKPSGCASSCRRARAGCPGRRSGPISDPRRRRRTADRRSQHRPRADGARAGIGGAVATAVARAVARAGRRRPGTDHGAQPPRPLVPQRDHAVRSWAAVQLGPAQGALRNNLFVPRETARALFVPPSRSRLFLRTALVWERIGLRWAKHFSGVLLMAAEKQIYAAPVEPARQARSGAGLSAGAAGARGGRAGSPPPVPGRRQPAPAPGG